MEVELVSVLLCTRGRRNGVDIALKSILANAYSNFEVLLIDQNDDDAIEALSQQFTDARLRYIRTDSRGKCRALNLGVELARGELIAVTDDDCEVPSDWLTKVVEAFTVQQSASLLYCNVIAASHDSSEGFIPVYERHGEALIKTVWQKRNARGIGAGSAFRKSVVLRLGGFDPELGPGSRFFAVDDWDLTIRALLMGYFVFETSHISVLHHGFRRHSDGRRSSWETWYGIGATYSKPLKAHHWSFAFIVVYDLTVLVLWPLVRDSTRYMRPHGLSRLVGFIRGLWAGLRTPVDREHLLFRLNAKLP